MIARQISRVAQKNASPLNRAYSTALKTEAVRDIRRKHVAAGVSQMFGDLVIDRAQGKISCNDCSG